MSIGIQGVAYRVIRVKNTTQNGEFMAAIINPEKKTIRVNSTISKRRQANAISLCVGLLTVPRGV
jgi:hypothetical protein